LKSSRSNISAALPADFGEAFDRAGLGLHGVGSTVFFFPSIGSTNDVALKLAARGGGHGAVVIADEQTSGRGRRGRAWFSPPGSGLYVSIVLSPARARHDPERATLLVTLMAGVALAEGVEASTGLRVDIKWPNDLYVARRKLAGILAEAAPGIETHVVLGYGINVGATSFPRELADRATSIETELGRRADRASLCAETVKAIARRYGDLLDARFDVILDAWRARAPASRGARVRWQTAEGTRTGVTAGIDDRGALLVDLGERVERIVGGEVIWW
jgi:BirA family transcriptional regulator, biotin operon repressor / biotin---[acetyl-CoA-carboxylase] ligase